MRAMGKNKVLLFGLGFLVAISSFCPVIRAEEERDKGYYTVYEENTNKKIFVTARVLTVGDRYLNDENNLYEVVEILGDDAMARFVEKVDIQQALDLPEAAMAETQDDSDVAKPNKGKKERIIGIYCTHSDESYVPTDGAASIPHNGGIYKVGASLKNAFEKKGIKVIQSFTSHDPHDAMAYERSRRTAIEMLKKGPDAVIDVHRDAVPAENYQSTVNGQPLAQLQLVVGRQNPQMETTNNFVKQIKANADKKYPGLVKGIFYGKGAYNQDLYPRNILIEAGTYLNPREKAQNGADVMADVIATTLYGANYEKNVPPGGTGTTKIPGEGGSAGGALLWIIGITVVGLGGYLLVSTGGIKELSAKTKRFMGSEFTNFLGNANKKLLKRTREKKDPSDTNEGGE